MDFNIRDTNPNNPVVILRFAILFAIVPIEGAVLFELTRYVYIHYGVLRNRAEDNTCRRRRS